jgi:DNA-binding GntR family transcriptional regulator
MRDELGMLVPEIRQEALTGYRRVAARLRKDIIGGDVAPGSWLRLRPIADSLGVSVQPVREALQQLEGEGLLEILPNRGARVHGLDRRRLVHIYEMREALESFMARRFAEEASLSELRQLQAIQLRHDAAVAAQRVDAVAAANAEFHRFINTRGDNPYVIDLVSRYIDLGHALVRRIGHEPGYLRRVKREHHAMLVAFRKRDASRAADLGAAHVRVMRETMLMRLDAAREEKA